MRLICALASLAAFSTTAQADEPPACAVETPVTAALVAEASKFGWVGFEAMGAAPSLLIGGLWYLRDNREIADGASGSVVFVRGVGGDWRAFVPAPEETVVAAFVAPSTGAVIFATQTQIEGPGQSWTLVRSTGGLTSGACTIVPFPPELNEPEWRDEFLRLRDLDIAANGRGEIIGATSSGGNHWYVYRTQDGGATWGPPRQLRRERQVRTGLFERIDDETAPPEALVADLRDFAERR